VLKVIDGCACSSLQLFETGVRVIALMEFRPHKHSDSAAIESLFVSVFTKSEGESEGALSDTVPCVQCRNNNDGRTQPELTGDKAA
jgi:hypothetical protein